MDSNIPLEELLADTKDLFVTETEVERSRELARQEWERRREANPDIGEFAEVGSLKSLAEQLADNKAKKDEEHRLRQRMMNMVGVMDEEDISYLDSIESTRRQAAWKREDEERRQVEAFRQKATEAAVMSARVSAGLAGAEDPFEELLPADASQVLQPLGGETPPAAAATATATPGDKPTVRRPAAGKARALAGVRVKRSNGPADVLEDRPTAGCKRPRSDDPAPEGADPAPRPGGHDVATKAADSAPKAVEPGPAAGALAGLLAQYESSSSSSSSSSSEEEDGD